jgi:indole-3-glycerol phosphate synthase
LETELAVGSNERGGDGVAEGNAFREVFLQAEVKGLGGELGATLVGINNRDLRTMTTDLDHVLRLRSRVPDRCTLVAESGIRSRGDVRRLEAAGIGAMLVGESLLKQQDPGAAAAALLADD